MIRRPASVSWFCAFAIIAALIDIVFAQMTLWSPDPGQEAHWMAAHPTGAKVQMGLTTLFGIVTIFTSYFIMQAKSWARWTYLGLTTLRYLVAFVLLAIDDPQQDWLYLSFSAAMVPGLLLLVMGYLVLFLEAARDYFHAADRPYWQVEEEEDQRRARS